MKIMIINGPNLNMLGIREPNIYGNKSYKDLCKMISDFSKKLNIKCAIYQSNYEGKIVELIQKAYFKKYDGIVINPAAYTHTSIAILDALKGIKIPTIEVHITDINSREEIRKTSLIKDVVIDRVIGKGFEGYKIAMENLKKYLEAQHE